MAVEVQARISFKAVGLWLSEEDVEPFSTMSRGVRFEFAPSSEADDSSTSTEVTTTAVFVPPDDVGARLVAQWPQLVEDVRAVSRQKTSLTFPVGPALVWFVRPEPSVVAFFANARHDLRVSARRIVGLLHWHFNIPALSEQLDPRSIEWSLNEGEWIEDVESRPHIFTEIGLSGWEVEGAQDLVEQLLDRDEREPLARELLAEAVRLQDKNARSALVVAITAAEVAVRSFVASRGREDAAWLLSRPQAPPLDDLLKNYLPFVTETKTRKGAVIPTELRKLIRRGTEARNKVVHVGEPGPDQEELARLLTAVNDLLYILDWLGGEAWAFHRVSDQWKDEYDAEDKAH